MELHTDLPTLKDRLDWVPEVGRIAERILGCPTPHVLGIHGDWGSGKTSFMRQVQLSLGGKMPKDASVDSAGEPLSTAQKNAMNKKVVTIWFDAWRYQNEPTPVVALLQEMRRQMSTMRAIESQFKKVGAIAMYSVLDNLTEIGKTISLDSLPSVEKIEKRGERWEKEHHEETLSTNSIRENLRAAIQCLLPSAGARVVVFIDDLDRCNPKAAIRLLEGLKIYMSIPHCVFVLGMNERILVDAIREELSAPRGVSAAELKLRAGHYLEKICTDIYRLPLPSSPVQLLMQWLPDHDQKQALGLAVGRASCLPPNPRRLKALANQWTRFASCTGFPRADNEQQKYWAVRVLVAAYIHQFHRDLWERWHFNPDFWVEIQAWCNGERIDPRPDWTKSLKLTYDETSALGADVKRAYPNPGDIENFWIGTLVREYRDHLNPRDFESLLVAPGGA